MKRKLSLLRQALAERVKPVLVINKFDRFIHELKLEPEDAYLRLEKMINDINNLIDEYQTDENKWLDLRLSPSNGNVVFTSAYRNWGFDIDMFADFYAKKSGKHKGIFVNALWGDWFLGSDNQINKNPNGKRMFNEYIYKPIKNLYDAILANNDIKIANILTRFDHRLNNEEKLLETSDLYKKLFKRIYPLSPVIKKLIAFHLPSPKEAQKYRVDVLYGGPLSEDDEIYKGIKNCDPNGPTVFFTSLMVPVDKDGGGSRFNAFGRLFSGTIKSGDKVTIMTENFEHGQNKEVMFNKNVQKIIKMVAAKTYSLDESSAGSIIALCGIDQYLTKSGTITSLTNPEQLYPIKTVKFVVSTVVQVAIKAKNPSDLPKLAEGLRRLSKSDPIIKCTTSENGENIIACVGELHAEVSVNALARFSGIELVVSEPVVPLRETILEASGKVCLKKSANKHNRIYMTAEPLSDELINDLESNEYNVKDAKNLYDLLVKKHNWDPNHARKVWGMAPHLSPSNLIVDCTTGLAYLNEIKSGVISGLLNAVENGIICGEPLRGIRFNIVDVTLHADAIHRGLGQIMPCTRDCIYACVLANNPTLYEPIFSISVATTKDKIGTVYSSISYKRGEILGEESDDGTPTVNISGNLPVIESFGFDNYIKQKTSGQAFPSMSFSHWKQMDEKLKNEYIPKTRQRKGLTPDVPKLENYLDKL